MDIAIARFPSLSHYIQLTDDERCAILYPHERAWRNRQPFLESHGYMLRPRLRPGWTPSWRTSGEHPLDAEDTNYIHPFPHLTDATRISDGKLVSIKRVFSNSVEVKIATYLRNPLFEKDTRNHCVPILDLFQDDKNASISYMVMPFLRWFDRPSFDSVDDVLDLGEQLLEGLVFLHEHGIAHRDCSYTNLMMDATPLFPDGFHPLRNTLKPDGKTAAWPNSRSHFPVKYYFIDFGISVQIPPDVQPKLAVGGDGRDQAPPELSDDVPYDPFKLDVFILGNVFRKNFYDTLSNVGFLRPIWQSMTQPDPLERPSPAEALQQWQQMRRAVPYTRRRWRLKRRDEVPLLTVILDVVHLVTSAAHIVKGTKTTKNLFSW
ncbi:kinase-like domain-containing protein [Rhodofomes roseus]|uniref:Kinase-like domain-containing protein n=1 Tax=Rhodofomes roseus TaxID=34475 RepID=A0ABQ8K9T2_9APHY|nr:kinase-like domain-containing protein [Rhodofomes roseus]KAH9834123.1 kinase-like domain-containing protein [Rhodofomes roseus]